MNRIVLTAALALSLAGATAALAQDTAKQKPDKSAPTADNSKNNKPDREIAADIRKAIVDDKNLSTEAHNAKVVVQHGKVTLRGNVASEDEKKSVEQKATDVAGAGNVTNRLMVKASRVKKSS